MRQTRLEREHRLELLDQKEERERYENNLIKTSVCSRIICSCTYCICSLFLSVLSVRDLNREINV